MTSAWRASCLKMSSPSGCFRFRVIDRLLRCRFWKSGLCRSMKSGMSSLPGISILMTWAPQSASCRTAVGPARARVRSRTVYLASAVDAGAGRIGAAFLRGLACAHQRSGPTVGTLLTRRERHACWVSTLPSPLSGCCAPHHRLPQRLALPDRRQGSLMAGASTARERDYERGSAADALFLLLFGSIDQAHGLFHVNTHGCTRVWPCHWACPLPGRREGKFHRSIYCDKLSGGGCSPSVAVAGPRSGLCQRWYALWARSRM